jgi:hypothetical protein
MDWNVHPLILTEKRNRDPSEEFFGDCTDHHVEIRILTIACSKLVLRIVFVHVNNIFPQQ